MSDKQLVDLFHFCLKLTVELDMKMEYEGDGFRISHRSNDKTVYIGPDLEHMREYLLGYKDGMEHANKQANSEQG